MDNLPELYSVFQGEVATVTAYGAFVRIPGFWKQGLVHKSNMLASHVDSPSEVVDVGDNIWCKVISMENKDDKGVKIALSMKTVNQDNGKDLDPNNLVGSQDERRRRQFRDHKPELITLGAVLNTVCTKCGCKGHFAKDCYVVPGGTKYELIPDDESPDTLPHIPEPLPDKGKANKGKEKRQKKRKKRTATDDSSLDEDEDSGGNGHKHKRKKCKMEKKKKNNKRGNDKKKKSEKKSHKRKHRSSSSD
uniref:zinc finger CCHC domain-containing protein 17 n=2 Tax=Myxine glutinosa TaxID=7769 RepID=UPI00359005F6